MKFWDIGGDKVHVTSTCNVGLRQKYAVFVMLYINLIRFNFMIYKLNVLVFNSRKDQLDSNEI